MTSQPGRLKLHLEGVLPAPPSLVFRALTDPPELAKWWGPHGFTCPGLELLGVFHRADA
jgi:uncharacterized protein YndB with AHSA1/START domain